MAGFCPTPSEDLGLVRELLGNVDCNVRAVSEFGYHAVSGPNSQLAFVLTAMMTIYVAIFGVRLLLGLAPLRVGDLTVTGIKLGVVLALATSWPTYQQVVFDTLFRGPEQLAASMLGAMQPADSTLRGNPFEGLQIVYDQLQASAAFFARLIPPGISPLAGGNAFAALSLNLAAILTMLTTLGVILAAKIVLGLLLALGPVFIALLLFDGTRGIFEGWLRAALSFAFVPLFATLALVVHLTLIEPYLLALVRMTATNKPDLAAATGVLVLSLVAASVSLAGLIGIFVVMTGFRLPWNTARSADRAAPEQNVQTSAAAPRAVLAAPPLQPRVAAISAAAASLERRDLLLENVETPRRLNLGAMPSLDAGRAGRPYDQTYRRSAQPRRASSVTRRDR